MRSSVAVAVFGLSACATVPGERPVQACDASTSEHFIGQPGTSETGAAILRATHASKLRWATPGMMMTMEFSSDRATVRVGPDRKIVAVSCG